MGQISLDKNSCKYILCHVSPFARCGKLFFLQKNNLGVARFACIISKKLIKKAYQRNRIRRRHKEIFRSHKCYLAGYDVVVLQKTSRDDYAYGESWQNMLLCWSQCIMHFGVKID